MGSVPRWVKALVRRGTDTFADKDFHFIPLFFKNKKTLLHLDTKGVITDLSSKAYAVRRIFRLTMLI
jgi:hypothetical protein